MDPNEKDEKENINIQNETGKLEIDRIERKKQCKLIVRNNTIDSNSGNSKRKKIQVLLNRMSIDETEYSVQKHEENQQSTIKYFGYEDNGEIGFDEDKIFHFIEHGDVIDPYHQQILDWLSEGFEI